MVMIIPTKNFQFRLLMIVIKKNLLNQAEKFISVSHTRKGFKYVYNDFICNGFDAWYAWCFFGFVGVNKCYYQSINKGGKIMDCRYSVWVGGTEINDFYLNRLQAENLAEKFINNGFDDVKIDKIKIKGVK